MLLCVESRLPEWWACFQGQLSRSTASMHPRVRMYLSLSLCGPSTIMPSSVSCGAIAQLLVLLVLKRRFYWYVPQITESRANWRGIFESTGKSAHVGVCHFSPKDLVVSSDFSKILLVKPSTVPIKHPIMSVKAVAGLMTTLAVKGAPTRSRGARSAASAEAQCSGKDDSPELCPCTEGDSCAEDLRGAIKVLPPLGVGSSWYAGIMPWETWRNRNAAAVERRAVHPRHFRADHLDMTGPHGERVYTALDGVAPRPSAVIRKENAVHATPAASDTEPSKAAMRAAAGELGVSPKDLEATLARHLIAVGSAPLPESATSAQAPSRGSPEAVGSLDTPHVLLPGSTEAVDSSTCPKTLGGVSDDDDEDMLKRVVSALRKHKFDVVKAIAEDDPETADAQGPCAYYTGFSSFEELHATFLWINAAGAFDNLRMYRVGVSGDDDEVVGPRRNRVLSTPLDEFIFWLCCFRRFRGYGLLRCAGDLFGLRYKATLRFYTTWTIAMGKFFRGQFHPATRAQAQSCVNPSAMKNLNLNPDKQCAYIGDCTERGVADPSDGALHSALFSSYKGRTTVKYLVVTTLSTYISFVPPCANGACSDNGLHVVSNVHTIL